MKYKALDLIYEDDDIESVRLVMGILGEFYVLSEWNRFDQPKEGLETDITLEKRNYHLLDQEDIKARRIIEIRELLEELEDLEEKKLSLTKELNELTQQ